jgi:hypothetical protein
MNKMDDDDQGPKRHFQNRWAARDFLETEAFRDGAKCPHCDSGFGKLLNVQYKTDRKRPVGYRRWKCKNNDCLKQFTVTSCRDDLKGKQKIDKWLLAAELLSKHPLMLIKELASELHVNPKTAGRMRRKILPNSIQ